MVADGAQSALSMWVGPIRDARGGGAVVRVDGGPTKQPEGGSPDRR